MLGAASYAIFSRTNQDGLCVPRKSPFHIELSVDEAAELRRRAAKYTLPYFKVVRAKMILPAAQDLNNDAIAARLDTRRQIIEPLFQSEWSALLDSRKRR